MSTTSDTQISDWSQKVKDMDHTGTIEHDPDINLSSSASNRLDEIDDRLSLFTDLFSILTLSCCFIT
jgi:hypothetical protein